jgi:hypothetical protein
LYNIDYTYKIIEINVNPNSATGYNTKRDIATIQQLVLRVENFLTKMHLALVIIVLLALTYSLLSDDNIHETIFQQICFTARLRAVYMTRTSVDCARKCARLTFCEGFIFKEDGTCGVLGGDNITDCSAQKKSAGSYIKVGVFRFWKYM